MSRKRSNYTRYSVQPDKIEELPNDVPVVEAGQVEEPEETIVTISNDALPEEEPIAMVSPVTLPEEPEIPLPEKAYAKKGVVANCTMVNVRALPNPDAKIAAIISAGDSLDIFYEENDFYKVVLEQGISGYIKKDFVSIV